MIYVVLGMHKSGTTLISETLHESGINMGEFSDIQQGIGYDEGHKYERRETQQINRQILDGVLKAPFDLFWFRSRRTPQRKRCSEDSLQHRRRSRNLNLRASSWSWPRNGPPAPAAFSACSDARRIRSNPSRRPA